MKKWQLKWGVGLGAQLRHLKKIPHGFGLLKYFTLFVFKEDLKTSEKHANCLKILHGKFRQFAGVIQMFAKENRDLSPWDCAWEALPNLSILHWMATQRSVRQSQTRCCYLEGKGPWNFHWLENNPALVFPGTLHVQAYDTEELWWHLPLWTTLSSFLY